MPGIRALHGVHRESADAVGEFTACGHTALVRLTAASEKTGERARIVHQTQPMLNRVVGSDACAGAPLRRPRGIPASLRSTPSRGLSRSSQHVDSTPNMDGRLV